MRPAFRKGGDAAIIPPLIEKSIPIWLQKTWLEAEKELSRSETWVVCGYSLPLYDKATRDMFKRAAAVGILKKIIILDPNSLELESRFKEIAPSSKIYGIQGLPNGLSELEKLIESKEMRYPD
jgi:hypothetical protein